MTDEEWVREFAAAIGMPAPSREEFDAALALAGIAAHASARTAAPPACWVAGASGKPLSDLIAAAERIAGHGE
jgi:Domain of unknown function (DUF6457)